MSDKTTNHRDDLGYLGASFQQKVLWQLLIAPDFAEQIIPNLTAGYFDNQIHKFIMNMIKKYFEDNNLPSTLRNRSIFEYIKGTNKSETDKELAFGILNQIINYDKSVMDGRILNDGDIVQKTIWLFVKQQESKKLANDIFDKIKTGALEENVHFFEESFQNILKLGIRHDEGEDVFYNIEDALREDYREVTPTGIKAMDQALAGGLGKGEMGIALMAYGVGKTTFLTKAANTAYNLGRNVLQIFFEDNEGDIKRKHYTLWTKIPLSQLTERREEAIKMVNDHKIAHRESGIGGRLVLKKWKSTDGAPTIPNIERWIKNYEKTNGIKFDILFLDYLDCCESHKPTHGDKNESELIIVKAFEQMCSDLNIPCWTAIQGNRSAVRSEYVHGDQMGGNIKRAQKTHFLFSAAKSQEQKMDNLANLQIIKSRMTKDGQMYENAIYNNDTLEIRCIEGMRPSTPNDKASHKSNNKKDQPLENLSFFNNMVASYVDNEVREKVKNSEAADTQADAGGALSDLIDNQIDKKPENISAETVNLM
jgi:replicative DNA helicase